MNILNFFKDHTGKESHSRGMAFLAFLMMVYMTVSEQWFLKPLDMPVFIIYAGMVGAAFGLNFASKKDELNSNKTTSNENNPT